MSVGPPWNIGDEVEVGYTFKNSAGVATDPTAVTLKIQTPAGVETSHVYGTDINVTRSGAGIYAYPLEFAESGIYTIRWIGTGAVVKADEETIPVKPSRFATP